MTPYLFLTVTGGLTAAWVLFGEGDSWFSYHTTFMTLGFLVFSNAAIWVAKRSRSIIVHMLLHLAAVSCIGVGYYGIHVAKESYGKPHWWQLSTASWHAIGGGLVVVLYATQQLGASVFLSPWKSFKARQPYVGLHRASGKLYFLAALAVLASGWFKLYADNMLYLGAFYGLLAIVGLGGIFMGRRTLSGIL